MCKLIFELAVYGEPATSDAAWSLLQHLIHNPVDMTFGERLSMLAQSQAPARTGIASGMQWFPPDEFWSKVCLRSLLHIYQAASNNLLNHI